MAPPVVCVVGGGTAGLEGVLMARHLLGEKARLRLVTPEREFRYRPMSADSLFRPSQERALSISDVVAHTGADLITYRVVHVDDGEGTLLTRDGDTVRYDYLLLAPGSTTTRALRPGQVWVRGGDESSLDRVLHGMLGGDVRSLGVVVPRGARWPLPAYELALVAAWTAPETRGPVTLVTAEDRPLATLGSTATDLVQRELLDNQRELWLAENPPGTPQPSTRCLWWPPGRAVGQKLAAQIAAWTRPSTTCCRVTPTGC